MVEWKVTPIIDRLNAGGPAPQPLGPLTQLPVQKGDTITVTAPGRYQQATSNHTFSLLSFIASLLQPAPAGTPPGADGSRRGGLPLLQVGLSSASLLALNQLPGGVPKAYLRVLSFNQDSVLVDQRTVQLTAAALGNYETLSTGQLIVQQDGYVGNESATDVYFDDVTIEHRQGLQVQENHYDPFGLDLAGVNATAPGLKPLNQYKFNGKEFQTDLGLNWNHQDWRFYDTQLGRWHVVDPEIENGQESWTPYSFGFDNAVRFADADGRCPGGICPPAPGVLETLTAAGTSAYESAAGHPATPFIVAAAVVGTAAVLLWDKLPSAQELNASLAGGMGPAHGHAPGDATKVAARVEANAGQPTSASQGKSSQGKKAAGTYSHPDSQNPLPKKPTNQGGTPESDPAAAGRPHTRLGRNPGSKGAYNQAREFDKNGKPVKDIDFTDHGRPANHTNPHQHPYKPNPTGGTMQRGEQEPLK